MDEIKIKSALLRKLVGSIIKKSIKKKTGVSANVDLNDLTAVTGDSNATVHIDLTVQMTKEEFTRLVKGLL